MINNTDMDNKNETIIVDNCFFVNGVKYKPIEKQQPKENRTTRMIAMMASIAATYAPYIDYGSNTYVRQLPQDVDIVKEYGLIQLKQSKLSKWERDSVVNIFERNFIKVEHD